MRKTAGVISVAAGLAWLLACGGSERTADSGEGDTAAPAVAPAAVPAPGVAATADPTNPQLIALGNSIFHGQAAGGTCITCHGQNGAGGQLGPNLTDAEWLHGDGSYDFLVTTITNGVATPKHFPAMMPPMGGAPLTPDQVRAVAAYVYSLSRRGAS